MDNNHSDAPLGSHENPVVFPDAAAAMTDRRGGMVMYWRLDDQNRVVPASDMDGMMAFDPRRFVTERLVRQDWWQARPGSPFKEPRSALLSTVFLVIDHGMGGNTHAPSYRPLIFETMFFMDDRSEEVDGFTDRYRTFNDAMAGHAEKVVRAVDMMGRDPDVTAMRGDQSGADMIKFGARDE